MELCELANQNVDAKKYNKQLMDFAHEIHAINAKTYAFARQALPLPVIATILNYTEFETIQIKSTLDTISRTPLLDFLKDYRGQKRLSPEEIVPVILAFDVTRVSSSTIKGSWTAGTCFTFILLPLNHRHSDLVVSSVWHKHCHINQGVRDLRDTLLRVMQAAWFLCYFIATSGDN
jgi:hypothetical protein